jgi:hypothetical protein
VVIFAAFAEQVEVVATEVYFLRDAGPEEAADSERK